MGKERQHYIPQVYLKEFTAYESRNIPKLEPFLYILEEGGTELKKGSAKNIGYYKNYYSLDDDNEEKRVVLENMLSRIEKAYGRIIKIIKNKPDRITLNNEERMNLALFIASFNVRVPKHKDNVANFINQNYEIMLDMMTSGKDKFNQVIKNYNDDTGKNINEEEAKELLEFVRGRQYTIEVDSGYVNALSFSPITEIADIIYNMHWQFLIAPANTYFISSDNPVVLYDRRNIGGFWGNGYKSSPTVELFFSITPQICFRGYWARSKNDRYRCKIISSNEVRAINQRICDYSHRMIFSCENKIWV